MSRLKSISRVIDLKDRMKEEKEMEVHAARNRMEEEKARLEALQADLERAVRDIRRLHRKATLHAFELEFLHDYCDHLDRQIGLQKEALARSARALNEKTEELVEAHRENRVMETFRDRLLSRKLRQEGREEQKRTDETFVSRRRLGG